MVDVQGSRVLLACLVASVLALAGCGNGQDGEVVHLHVFNAYPGADSISVYGPSGVVARDLPFGQRTEEPVAVERNLGEQFTIIIDGAPDQFQTSVPVWSMYPHETGTILFKRRTGENSIDDPVLYRHVQTGYRTGDDVPPEQQQEACRLVLDNALSGESSSLMNMTYLPAFRINPNCVGYRESIGSFTDPRGSSFIQRVANSPFFYPVDVEGSKIGYIKDGPGCPAYNTNDPDGRVLIPGGTVEFVWAGGNYSEWFFEDGGNIRVQPTTGDLMQCLGWDPERPAADQSDLITPDTLATCLSVSYETEGIETTGTVDYFRFPVGLGQDVDPGRCGFDIRADSDFESIFTGQNLNGEPVIERAEFSPNQYYFWVLYGRPVNPLVEKWGSNQPENGGGFVELPDYPGDPGANEGQ
jgi:hypothetical protein